MSRAEPRWRRRLLGPAALLLFAAGCAGNALPTPMVLGDGWVRHWPQSSPIPIGSTVELALWTHCGLDQALIDFAGTLWVPLGVPRGNGGVIAPPALVADPQDAGTITLLSAVTATYEAQTGNVILLRAVRGPRDVRACY